MNIIDSIRLIQNSGKDLFSIEDIKKILRIKKENTLFKTAGYLVKKKVLSRIYKGRYIYSFSTPNQFQISNFIYCPSYISLESALNFYGVLIQTPYQITSVTPIRNKHIIREGKEYLYMHISKELYFGYRKEKKIIIATPEKALIDELYFISKGLRKLDFSELCLSQISRKTLISLSKQIKNKYLLNMIGSILDDYKRQFK